MSAGHRLSNKVAIVSGAAGGIGSAAARRFHAEGAKVLLADVNVERGEALARTLGAGAQFVRVDHTLASDCVRAVEAAVDSFGSVDILYNNAGIGWTGPIEECDDGTFSRMMDVLLAGYWKLTRAALPALKESGKRNEAGAIVLFTASVASLYARPYNAPYTIAKHGVLGVMRSFAVELGPHNIRVNAILPGAVDTEMLRKATGAWGAPEAVLRRFAEETPLRRLADVNDIADAALFLASDEAKSISAHALVVDGGLREY